MSKKKKNLPSLWLLSLTPWWWYQWLPVRPLWPGLTATATVMLVPCWGTEIPACQLHQRQFWIAEQKMIYPFNKQLGHLGMGSRQKMSYWQVIVESEAETGGLGGCYTLELIPSYVKIMPRFLKAQLSSQVPLKHVGWKLIENDIFNLLNGGLIITCIIIIIIIHVLSIILINI